MLSRPVNTGDRDRTQMQTEEGRQDQFKRSIINYSQKKEKNGTSNRETIPRGQSKYLKSQKPQARLKKGR